MLTRLIAWVRSLWKRWRGTDAVPATQLKLAVTGAETTPLASHRQVASPYARPSLEGFFYRVFKSRDYSKYRNPDREARRAAGWPSGRQWVKMRKAARRVA